ncbi:MAG: hypothetical protein ACPGNV_12990 [Mangrovicoccus sp.]
MSYLRAILLASVILGPAAGVTLAPSMAEAKRIEQACKQSDRRSANSQICGCIQRVADQILTSSDQRLAAKFFKDPQRAQDIRQSDNSNHEAFWKRYKAFGQTAGRVCS